MRWLWGVVGFAAFLFGLLVVLTAALSMGTTEAKAPVALVGVVLAFGGLGIVAWAALWPRRT